MTALFRALPVAAALSIAASLPTLAQTREEVVRFEVDGQTVVGTLTLPAASEPAPVVLMLFGFLGNRAEWPIAGTEEGPYARAARLWAENGIASLRIDFRGSGESEGSFPEASLASEVADGVAAIGFLKGDERLDAERLGIVGWSLGGLIATSVAAATGEADAVALWNAVAQPVETFTGLLGGEVMAAGLEAGDAPIEAMMPWGQPVAVGRPMIAELHRADPATEIAGYSRPLFVAQGSLDMVVVPAGAQLYLAAHQGPEEFWTREMDHMFNMEQGPAVGDELFAATQAFFARHLR